MHNKHQSMSTKAYHAPVRPPRGSKVSKDTSGRLINIIAELSVSKHHDDRKRKMHDLKKDLLESDAKLLKLLTANRDKLSVISESFTKISAKINTSRRGCQDVKAKLISCKKLLECKREDIRRLWSESVEHDCVLNMFKEIAELNNVAGKIEDCLIQQEFLKATEILVAGVSLLEGKLSDADALKDLKSELDVLKKKLHHVFVQEINKQLYKSYPLKEMSVFVSGPAVFEKFCEEPGIKNYDELFGKLPSVNVKLPPVEGSYDFSASQNVYDEIQVLLECISLLNTVPETVEVLKENCTKELMLIIRNTSETMYHCIQNAPYIYAGNIKEQPHYLRDLLNAILHQFRQVAINHFAFLDNMERIAMTKNVSDIGTHYEMADVYSKLQSAVALFLSDYLDLHNTNSIERVVTPFAKLPTNLSVFFMKKGNITHRAKRKPNSLFKFDSSSHAINQKTYLQDEREKDALYRKEKGEVDSVESDKNILISQPNAKNIKVVYTIVKDFISEVENLLHLENGAICPLHTFLSDCVKVFLEQVTVDVNKMISSISLESWRPVSDPDLLKLADVKAPQILNSTLTVNSSIKEIEELLYGLPDTVYSSHFLQLIVHVFESYADVCSSAYKSLIFADSEEHRIFSVSWARDPDISRLLRSLPNWKNLEYDEGKKDDSHNFEESPEEVRFRNKAESELLIRHLLGNKAISQCEIISQTSKLTNLALMHESMEYFSSEITSFAERLPDSQASVSLYLPEKFNDVCENDDSGMSTKGVLKKLAKDFQELASTSLLVLHLELRAHCFYYLLKLSKTYSYRKDDEEPEPEVQKFLADLSKIHESLSPVLQPKKMRYVIEGLGELLATIFINSVANIKKINENGVKKMGRNIFAIQQNLAGITMTREVALDRARQYFDLLNHTYEDILNQIVEEGPQFQEHEYSSLIQLLHNSREGVYEQSLNYYLEKLRQILDEVAVSV